MRKHCLCLMVWNLRRIIPEISHRHTCNVQRLDSWYSALELLRDCFGALAVSARNPLRTQSTSNIARTACRAEFQNYSIIHAISVCATMKTYLIIQESSDILHQRLFKKKQTWAQGRKTNNGSWAGARLNLHYESQAKGNDKYTRLFTTTQNACETN